MSVFVAYASETWPVTNEDIRHLPVTNEDIRHLERNDMMMVRWICSTKLSDKIPSNELKGRLHIIGVEDTLQWGRL